MPPRLTIIPYLQRWLGSLATLEVNVLLLPTGNPLAPLSDGWSGVTASPAFAASSFTLTANLAKSVHELPLLSAVDHTQRIVLDMPGDRSTVFAELQRQFQITKPDVAPVRSASRTLRKYLPKTYREAFSFVAPRTPLAVVDDSYFCDLRCPVELTIGAPSRGVSWGQAIAFGLRQPALARAMGMLHSVRVQANDPEFFAAGGWLFFTLEPDSDQATQAASPGFLRVFATRVPKLEATSQRPVFTPVLFPVSANAAAAGALGNFDEVFTEAVTFDDGFTSIVHGGQPLGADMLDEDGAGLAPLKDEGIQLGWDDEVIVVGQNRHVGLNPDGSAPPEAPRGIAGYRVDVRADENDAWHSLTRVATASLPFGIELGPLSQERWTEVHPNRIENRFWLPMFFCRWKGGSLVTRNRDEQRLLGIDTPGNDLFHAVDADDVLLRYGRRYQFRVRMADLTGGGPSLDDEPVNPAEAPIADIHFRRLVPPGRIDVSTTQTTTAGQPVRFRVHRPGIGFPQAVFTGAPNAMQRLMTILEANIAGANPITPVAIADPDASYVEVRVLVRPPAFDSAGSERGWLHLYTTARALPNDHDASLDLNLAYVDVSQLADLDLSAQLGALGTSTGSIVVPTARDVRLELRALGRNDMTYFGNERARRGEAVMIELHEPANVEAPLFRPALAQRRMRSVFLRPDSIVTGTAATGAVLQHSNAPLIVQRLAAALDLRALGSTLHGLVGQRVIFGCNGLSHYLSPDASGLELVLDELPQQWINVVSAEIDRDWTWKGFADPTFVITRTVKLPSGATLPPVTWSAQMHHSVHMQATREGEPVRDRTFVVLVDAFTAPLDQDLPCELEVHYEVIARLEGGEQTSFSCNNRLPVTTPPSQLPKVVAAGFASTAYVSDDLYRSTTPRRRMLWLEFAEAPVDRRDTYFIRVLAHAPDPMLLAGTEPVADPPTYDKPLLDPELIRVVTPGQADDFAGLAAMQRLIPSKDSPKHYAVPLPANTAESSSELFGFYTYEIRVGHDSGPGPKSWWSIAQGRYSPGIVLEGVQHPAPPIECHTSRNSKGVVVSATYAQPHHNGRNLTPSTPNTEIWAALYQQIHQADGASMRNILLDTRRVRLIDDGEARQLGIAFASPQPGQSRETVGFAWWSENEIKTMLAQLGTRADSPLSVLAVEVLPEPNGWFGDPLGGDLGEVRILRTSPLTAITDLCC